MKIPLLLTFRFAIILLMCLIGCDEILDVTSPKAKIPSDSVFENDVTATTAVTGIYIYMTSAPTFASGSANSIVGLAGLSSDELIYIRDERSWSDFQDNSLVEQNEHVASLWRSAYRVIYETNLVIERLSSSNGVTEDTKRQLLGEALFIRGFTYFYLVNTFGDVPYVTSTDYQKNRVQSRVAIRDIYRMVLDDCRTAQSLLKPSYPTAGRVRPNKGTVTAFLARLYLFNGEWQNAIDEASRLIDSTQYRLEPDLNNVFVSTSTEAIWQLMPSLPGYNTNEGREFLAPDGVLKIAPDLLNAFSDTDARLANWIDTVSNEEAKLFFPTKYKVMDGSVVSEYSMVFRLAEQYLIRSEAYARLADFSRASDDLNAVRVRAGLDANNWTDLDELLSEIVSERRRELFAEWGHRWYDLKRLDLTTSLLAYKGSFSKSDELYPIPVDEFAKNPALGDQNPGY